MKLSPMTKHFGGALAVETPEIILTPGKITAVVGANGSGKSTFARVTAGVLPSDTKKSIVPPGCTVGYMPQRSYPYRMSVEKNLLLVKNDPRRAAELLEAIQLTHLAKKPAHLLSGGETARMALVRLMMRPFDLVILDEPTASMDMESTVLSEALMRRCVQETGCALLLITHSLQQARRLADEVLFFYRGALWESGDAETVLYTPKREETRQFLSFYGA